MLNIKNGSLQGSRMLARCRSLIVIGALVFLGMVSGPLDSQAAIGTAQNWPATPIYANAAYPSAAITYNAVAGNNRLLVVGISSSTTSVAQTQPTVTYGGTPMTYAVGYSATATQQHSYLFYLPLGSSATNDTGKSISVTNFSGGTSRYCIVNAAVYTGVDQTSPVATSVPSSNTTTASTSVGPFTLAVNSGELGISILNTVRTGTTKANAGTITIGTTGHVWTQASTAASGRIVGALRTTFATTLNANTTSQTLHTSSATTLNSTAAIAIKPMQGVTVSDGSSVAGNKAIYINDGANSSNVVVDAFSMTASAATTVTSITFGANANTTSANVSAVKIWRKVGSTLTAWEASDQLVGSAAATGGNVVFSGLNESVSTTTQNYIVTYDISTGATASTANVLTGTITAIAPTPLSLTDTSALSASIYIYPTTSLGNGTEPPTARLWKSSAPTNLDAFTLVHDSSNATDNDSITIVTVTMSPTYISGGTGSTESKIKLLEVVGATCPSGVCGSKNAAATGDTWNIPTSGMTVTSTPQTFYLRISTADTITPSVEDTSGTPSGYYTVGGRVTALVHGNSNNKLTLNDSGSQTLYIDVEKPTGLLTANSATGTVGGTIDLSWALATDDHGGSLDAVKPYLIMRGTTQPSPGCIDGTDISTVPGVTINYAARTATDAGLIDTTPTRYYYRICAKDAQGNVSDGAATYANSKVSSYCNVTPTVDLKAADNVSTMQIIKSLDTTPFKLQITDNDIGVCDDIEFDVALANESADKVSGTYTPDISHFDKKLESSPFPTKVKVGIMGNAGAPKARTSSVFISGNSYASQLEKYTFSITVSHKVGETYTHSTPITTAPVTGLLNDMPPIVHNSSNMGKYQYGNWGVEITCATCHTISTSNIKGVFQVISSSYSGKRPVVFTKTSSVATDYDGVFGNDKRPNKNTSYYICSVCHHKTRQHQYSASKVSSNYLVGEEMKGIVGPDGTEAYNDSHHNGRDCAKCHTHNTAFRSIFGACGDCHGFKNTGYSPINKSTMVKDLTLALGTNPTNYGAHLRHNTAKITCIACHNNSNHALDTIVWQGNNDLEMGFTMNKDTFPGFNPNVPVSGGVFYAISSLNPPFVWKAGTDTTIVKTNDYNASCTTYCHGGWSGNVGSISAPIWVGAGQAACGTCHNATGAVPPVSGSHPRHAGNTGTGLGIGCERCHATYSNYTGSAHINGNVQWKLVQMGSAAAYKGTSSGSTGTPAGAGSYGTCTNIYCHSDVQGKTGNGTGGPNTYASPIWGGTVTCGDCHADPNTSGSHPSHEDVAVAFDCHVCHNNGGRTSPLNHANGIVNFEFVGLGQNTVYSAGTAVPAGTPYGTCSSSNCHGRFTRAWGTPASGLTLCDKCHGSATSPGGFYNTRGPAGTLSIYSAGIGVHDIHLQNPYSPRKATFARFTSYAKGFTCRECHDVPTGPFTAGHIDTMLPAEVPFSHLSSIASTGQKKFSYYTTAKYTAATQTCSAVWCHGAGMNSNNSTGPYVGVPGSIQRQDPQWNVPFLTGNSANDCTKCHALPPPAPDANYIHYGKTMADCKTCHTHLTNDGLGFRKKSMHVNGVIDGDCSKCHGYPPINNIVGDHDGLATPQQGALRLGTAGAHNVHVLNPNIGKNCSTCHYNYTPDMPSNNLELGFSGFNGAVTSGTFTGYSGSGVHPQWRSTNAGTVIQKVTTGANVCSNLYCHGGGIWNGSSYTLNPLGGGSNTAPNWEGGPAEAVCGTCHGTDSINAPTGGSHTRHALAANGGVGMLCNSCHGSSTNMTHVNGTVSWHLDRSLPTIGANATYNNISSGSITGLAPRNNGADYRYCNNVYCHSNVQGANGIGDPTSYATVRWGTGTLDCGSCHKNMATDAAATGSHVKHANTGASNMALPCGYCHQDGGSGSLNHADNLIFVNFTSYVGGTYSNNNRVAGSAAGYGTCSATFCHGTIASPAWGSGPIACNACHGASADRTTSATWSGRHATHYNYSTIPTTYNETLTDYSNNTKYRFNCKHCHDADSTKHSLKPYSSTAYARVFFGLSTNRRGKYAYGTAQVTTDNGFKYTAGSCNTSYCHSNGRQGAPLVTTLTWTTTPTTGSNCLYCHDGKKETGTSSLSPRHDRHMNPSVNTSLGLSNGQNCQDCHMKTIAADNVTILNKFYHVNGYVDFSSVHGGPSNYNRTTKVCSNVYCHSNGNRGAIVYVNMTGQKAWGGTTNTATCNFCHGRSNALGTPDYANGGANTATANLHQGHMSGLSDTTGCSSCHRRTASPTIANKFVDYSAGTTHLNGGVNIYFDKSKAFIGTKATVSTVGFQTTCSQIVCHGQGAPIWGTSTTANQCQKCHGSRSTAFITYTSPQVAPGYGTDGTDTSMTKKSPTDPRVGAHQKHLSASVLSTNIKCGECHVPVTAIRSGNHWNYSTATITFNGRATGNGHSTASFSRNGSGVMQCSNTWCHTGKSNSGTYVTPYWNYTGLVKEGTLTVASCKVCHGFPPKNVGTGGTALTYNHSALADPTSFPVTTCTGCHSNMSNTGTTYANVFAVKSKHVDGTIDASGGHAFPYPGSAHATAGLILGDCTGCHTNGSNTTYPVLAGIAPDCRSCHTIGLMRTAANPSCYDCHGANATDGMPNGNAFPNYSGSHSKHVVGQSMVCSACHGPYGGNIGDRRHGFSNRTAHTFSFVNVTSTTKQFHYSATGKGTCSTNVCHATAEWGVTKIGCNGCHGYDTTGGGTTWLPALNVAGGSGAGLHAKHINFIKSRLSIATMTPLGQTFGQGEAKAVCGTCHTNSAANHTPGTLGTRTIDFGSSTFTMGSGYSGSMTLRFGSTDPSFSTSLKTCSNLMCHYATTPSWY